MKKPILRVSQKFAAKNAAARKVAREAADIVKKRAAARATTKKIMRSEPNVALKKLLVMARDINAKSAAAARKKTMEVDRDGLYFQGSGGGGTDPGLVVLTHVPVDPEKARYESYAKAHDLMRRADLIRALYTAERELELYRHKYDQTMEGRVKALEEKLAWVSSTKSVA